MPPKLPPPSIQSLIVLLTKSLISAVFLLALIFAVLPAGTGAALGGVFLYSRLTRTKKPKKA
jgi:solute carrier family 35 protein E1